MDASEAEHSLEAMVKSSEVQEETHSRSGRKDGDWSNG